MQTTYPRGKSKGPSAGYFAQIEKSMQQADQKRAKKPRQAKWWQLSNVSIPLLRSIPGRNKKIDEARIEDLTKRVEHKKALAVIHMDAGRFGKANKMANRARSNEREIRKIERRM